MIFQFFLDRQVVELAAECELPVHLFLADVEVLDVEEPFFPTRQQNTRRDLG